VYEKTTSYIKEINSDIEAKAVKLDYYGSIGRYPSHNLFINEMDILEYSIKSEWWHMDGEQETIYDTNGENPVTTITNYTYDSEIHRQPTEIRTINSKGEVLVTKNAYPSDSPPEVAENILQGMVNDNIVTPLIKTETSIEGGIKIGGTINKYRKEIHSDTDPNETSDMYLLDTIQSLKTGTITEYESRIEFTKYDNDGNILEVKKTNGISISYIWGYNNNYPVAKIENATWEDIITLSEFSTGFNAGEGALTVLQEQQLRSLSGAMVTTYTYKPLIGITSMTDPRNYTIYYEYDEYNRLKEVRNQDTDIITDYKYHYKGQ